MDHASPRAEQILTLSRGSLLKALHGMPLAVPLSPASLPAGCLQLGWGEEEAGSPSGVQGPGTLCHLSGPA